MSEVMPLGPFHEMPRCDSKAGCQRSEWVVMFADGYTQSMFGGRFYIPPHSEVIAIVRRDVLKGPRGQELLKIAHEQRRGGRS